MDPVVVQQVELRDLMRIKAKTTNPKPLNGRLYNFHALLRPLFIIVIIILLVSYFLPGLLRCYFCPVSISCANLVGLLAGKKALIFLFSNFIFILLVLDFTLSSPSNNSFTTTPHNIDNSASSLQGRRLPSDSNNAIVVGDAPAAAAEQLHDDPLWMPSSLLQVEQVISLEQKSSISVDSFAGEKKLAKEESKTNIDIFGDFLTEIGDQHIEWRPADLCCNESQQGRQMKTVERGNIPTLEVVVVVDDAIGNELRTDELEALGIEDELEHLELEELNRKFDEFIARKKNKWRSEASAAASHAWPFSLKSMVHVD